MLSDLVDSTMLVLGIDPGTVTMGYGIIETDDNDLTLVDYGTLTEKTTSPISKRLNFLPGVGGHGRRAGIGNDAVFGQIRIAALSIHVIQFDSICEDLCAGLAVKQERIPMRTGVVRRGTKDVVTVGARSRLQVHGDHRGLR